jgi:tripartite-type tricarboxylate transporter receptor subunit TctC
MPIRRRLLLALPALLPGPARAQAQGAWPDRPVRIVVPYPPGGSVDGMARLLQPRLAELLGRPVVIENKSGGGGSVGTGEIARSTPDGHNWALVYDNHATNASVMRLPFDTLGDFAGTSLLAAGPLALVAHKDTPWRTLADLVADAKRRPEAIAYATSGAGALAHVATTQIQAVGGFRLTHVPYRGGGPALQDNLAGHVPLFMSNLVIIKPHIAAGTLRPLGVTTRTESPLLPGVKSFAEQGFGDIEALTWWALVAPARTPAPIVAAMSRHVATALNEPATRARIEEQGAQVRATSPAETDAFLRAEVSRWEAVIRAHDIRAEG